MKRNKGKGEKMSGKYQKGRQHKGLVTLGNKLGGWKGRWARCWGDGVMGTGGGTWRDEHWVLCYVLAN